MAEDIKVNTTYTFEIPVKITDETIDNILWTAFNCGSTYWIYNIDIAVQGNTKSDTVYEQLTNGGSLSIEYYDSDDDSTKTVEYLTLDKFLRGLKQYITEFPKCIENGEVDSSNIDSSHSDLILQYALFNGEQVFG